MTRNAFDKFIELYPNRRLNVLLSYGIKQPKSYFNREKREHINSLMLDSGTFSMFNKDVELESDRDFVIDPKTRITDHDYMTVEEYKNYLTKYGTYKKYDYIFNFDQDFRDTEQAFITNKNNFEYLKEDSELNLLPVIHLFSKNDGGDIKTETKEIEYYLENSNQDLIGVGSAYGKLKDDNVIFQKIYDLGKKVHYLGKSHYGLSEYPITSCDSTSWTQEAYYGKVRFWDSLKGSEYEDKTQIVKLTLDESEEKKLSKKGKEEREIQLEKLKTHLKDRFGMTLKDLIIDKKRKKTHLVNCQAVNILYYTILEEKITEKQLIKFNNEEFFGIERKSMLVNESQPVWEADKRKITVTKKKTYYTDEDTDPRKI